METPPTIPGPGRYVQAIRRKNELGEVVSTHFYFRRKDCPGRRLEGCPGTVEFDDSLAAAIAAGPFVRPSPHRARWVQAVWRKRPRGRSGYVYYYRRKGFPAVRLTQKPGTALFKREVWLAGQGDRERTGRHLRGEVMIYFVQAEVTRAIKIGSSLNVGRRIVQLQVGMPERLRLLGVLPDSPEGGLEGNIKRRFRHHCIRGEWFREHPDILTYIERFASEAQATA